MHLDRWDRSLQLVQGFKSGVNYCPTLWQIVLVCVSVTDKDTVIPIMFRHQSPDEWINVFKLSVVFVFPSSAINMMSKHISAQSLSQTRQTMIIYRLCSFLKKKKKSWKKKLHEMKVWQSSAQMLLYY